MDTSAARSKTQPVPQQQTASAPSRPACSGPKNSRDRWQSGSEAGMLTKACGTWRKPARGLRRQTPLGGEGSGRSGAGAAAAAAAAAAAVVVVAEAVAAGAAAAPAASASAASAAAAAAASAVALALLSLLPLVSREGRRNPRLLPPPPLRSKKWPSVLARNLGSVSMSQSSTTTKSASETSPDAKSAELTLPALAWCPTPGTLGLARNDSRGKFAAASPSRRRCRAMNAERTASTIAGTSVLRGSSQQTTTWALSGG